MSKQRKDKRFGVNRVIEEVHKAYDFLEAVSLQSAEKALREEFGFGEQRLARFREAYLMHFGEFAAAKAEEIRAKLDKERRKM